MSELVRHKNLIHGVNKCLRLTKNTSYDETKASNQSVHTAHPPAPLYLGEQRLAGQQHQRAHHRPRLPHRAKEDWTETVLRRWLKGSCGWGMEEVHLSSTQAK